MTDDPKIGGELPPDERALAERLHADRPVPAAAFRGALGRRLAALDPGYGPRPERLRPTVSGLLGASALLLALGALQATGAL
jgi:hypothetical protein